MNSTVFMRKDTTNNRKEVCIIKTGLRTSKERKEKLKGVPRQNWITLSIGRNMPVIY